jgi:hypothetical protein
MPAAGTTYGNGDAALTAQACDMPGTIRKAATAAAMARFLGLRFLVMSMILTFLLLYLAASIAAFDKRCAEPQKTGSKNSRSMYNSSGMLLLLRRCLCLLVICSAPGLAAAICATGTLASYEALGAGGCQIGSLTVNNFSYAMLSGTVTIPDTSITVTPSVVSNTLGLTFSSPLFSVSGTDSAVYMLGYTWDPGDIRSLEDILNTNTPVFPGLARISTLACLDSAFSGAICPTTTDLLVVSHNGIIANTPNTVTFSPPIGILGIRNTIETDGNGASSEFTSFENVVTLPEPSTLASCLLFSLVMFGGLRLKRG